MILIPKNCARVTDLAAKDRGRFSLTGVQVVECRDDNYRLLVTDGKTAAIVGGPSVGKPEGDPVRAKLKDAPNGQHTYLVSREDWEAGWRLADKRDGYIGLVGCEGAVSIGGPKAVSFVPQLDGLFPDVMGLQPGKGKRSTSVRVNALLLVRLLKVAAEFAEDDTTAVDLVVFDGNTPVVVMTRNKSGQTFDGLIMPMS